MDINLLWILPYLLLGGAVGFMAGLLGVGGGSLMVPVLTSLFLLQGIPVDTVVHLALGTSMAAIVVTSFSSMRAHHQKGLVQWSIFRQILPGIVIGTFSATFLVWYLNAFYLTILFTIFIAYVSIQIFLDIKPKPTRTMPSAFWVSSAGGIIGILSAMVSIGGGALSVPYMTWHNVNLKKAISTSAAIGFPISVVGSIGYIINGLRSPLDIPLTIGYVNIFAVLCIASVSYFVAPIGANLAHRLPTKILKKVFAFVFLMLSIKMLFSIILNSN